MKHSLKVRGLIRSITGLFGTNKPNITFLNHKEEYYRACWFNKKLYEGIELVAAFENTTKKQAAELLMKAGLSSYMGEKIADYIKSEQAARELNQKIKMTRFIQVLRRYTKEKGMDISKII
jgi:hypothetical protein